MGAAASVLSFDERFEAPTLVLVDLQMDAHDKTGHDAVLLARALERCRVALDYARRQGMPVAFVRHVTPPASFLATPGYSPWIAGFEPRRSDMIFERTLPSCYASTEFAHMAARSKGLVLAGLFGEAACLSTLIEGHNRKHGFTYLADASHSLAQGDVSAADMHRSVVGIAARYSRISWTRNWMADMPKAGVG